MTVAVPKAPGLDPPLMAITTLPPLYRRLTREGTCVFRRIPVGAFGESRFWAHWKANTVAWAERGFSLGKEDGSWFVQQWLTDTGYLTSIGAERLARLLAPPKQAEMDLEPAIEELAPLPPGIEDKLFPYQRIPARQLYRAVMNGLKEWDYPGAADLSDMGLGKTYQSLAAAIATGRKIIVLCPVVGQAGWERAFAHFGADPHFIGTYEAVRGNWRPEVGSFRGDGQFWWKNHEEILIILDEAQAVRHDTSLTFQVCGAAIRQCIPIIMTSATIAVNPIEMRFCGRITGLHKGGSDYERFLYAHGCAKWNGKWRWNQDLNTLVRIHSRLFPRRGCRVRREDIGDQCPETVIEVLPMEISEGEQIELEWRDVETLVSKLREQRMSETVIRMRERRARMVVWQKSELALLPEVARRIRDDLDNGRSVCVFLTFVNSRKTLARMFNSHAGFYGGQNLKTRRYWEDQFQANKVHLLINQIGAGGASVSLHDTTGERPRTAYVFPTDKVIHMVQATGRIDRVGGKSVSYQFIPCVKGTLSERMVAVTRRKMRGISAINDGTRGGARI